MYPDFAIRLLQAVLTASWQGSLVMLLILALRPLLGIRVPARWRCVLWTFVLVRLLVPAFILPRSPASLQNIPIVERPGERVAIAFDTAYTSYFSTGRSEKQESNPIASTAPRAPRVLHPHVQWRQMPWWKLGAVIWAAGAALLAAWILGGTLRLRRRLQRDEETLDDSVAAIWRACSERWSVSHPPRLLVASWMSSPALVGVFHPALLIPRNSTGTFSGEDWEHLFMHELAHYRRRDHWTHGIELLALCVHWFNPLVWLGFRFLAADRELAADELALQHLRGDRAVGYGDTLLKVLSVQSPRGLQPGMIGILDGSANLEQRFRRIVAFGPSRIVGSMVGLALILVVAVVVLGRESTTPDLSRYRNLKPADALVVAAANNDLPVVRKLLDEGLDINSPAFASGEKTALAAAAAANQMDAVRFLVTQGAQINPPDAPSSPALLAAVRNGALGCAGYLLAKGAVCDPDELAKASREEASRNDRVYQVSIPAPRGQILDRHGKTLVTNRVISNLAIRFPSLLQADADVLAFVRQQVKTANRLLPQRSIDFSVQRVLRHYKNWGVLPMDIAGDLTPDEQNAIAKQGGDGLTLRPSSLCFYPNGPVAAHLFGYVGKAASSLDRQSPDDDQFSSEFVEGRDGLELVFNEVLTGKPGQQTYHFDAQGKRISDEMTKSPESGKNVVTTLDLDLQKRCERALQEGSKRGAMVVLDPNTGEVLAMASWPTFDPNTFIPAISAKAWNALNNNPDVPLVDRAFAAAYPPGPIFKVFVGLSALESGVIKLDEKIPNPPSLQIGDHTFHDWKNSDRGMLTFAEALEQNADTWFFQVGMKTGARTMIARALDFGFSRKTGINLPGEKAGLLPTDDYIENTPHQDLDALFPAAVANLSIGQGETRVTPVQVAQAMAILANSGKFKQTRLVSQLQDHDGRTTGEYQPLSTAELKIKPEILAELKKAMVAVVNGKQGTGHAAAAAGLEVAGVTGSSQSLGPANQRRTFSWFAGYAPANRPAYAFAAITESDQESEHVASAAPIVGQVLGELFPADDGTR